MSTPVLAADTPMQVTVDPDGVEVVWVLDHGIWRGVDQLAGVAR